VAPPSRPLGRLAFIASFVRNPLAVVPQAVYERDLVVGARGATPMVWITGPALLKKVLLDECENFQKQAQMRLLGPLLGRGVLTSDGADWKWQRQASAPMFRQHELLAFVPAFVRATQKLLARWRASPSGAVQAIERDMTAVTFDVISATLLPSADGEVGAAIEQSTASFQRAGAWGQLYAIANAPKWLPRPGGRSQLEAVRHLRGAVAGMIRARRAAEARGAAPDDLMRRLMLARDPESGQSMNDEQLVDNLLTFYLAGHETTAKALTWTLYLLARSPDWSAALEEEVARVTGGEAVTAAHIERLALVQRFLKEAMRLYPPVPMFSRQAMADTRLDGVEIRAGTSVVMPIYAIHRHAARWQDPDAFDPGRFAPEREARQVRYQYIPFGAGPRICIGMYFAMIEATAIVATLMQHARFATVEGHEPAPVARVTLMPRGGMPLRVSLR
jgi:cytochrome P450